MTKKITKMDFSSFIEEASGLLATAKITLDELRKSSKDDTLSTLARLYIFFHSIGKSSSYMDFNALAKVGNATSGLINMFITGESLKCQPRHKKLLSETLSFVEECLKIVEKEYSDKKMEKSSEKLLQSIEALTETKKVKNSKKPSVSGKKSKQENKSNCEPETDFTGDAGKILDGLEKDLKLLKDSPADKPTATSLLQKTRLLRGSCGVYGYKHLEKLNRSIEVLLEKVEAGTTFNMDELVDVLLIMKDVNHDTITAISGGENGDIFDLGSYLDAIDELRPLASELKQDVGKLPQKPEGSGQAEHQPGLSEKEAPIEEEIAPVPASAPVASSDRKKHDGETENGTPLSPELVEAFVQETDDMLPEIEGNLLEWADTPEDLEIISNVFRRIHSLKGNCGFYGFKDLETLSHQIETILSAAKSGASLDTARLVNTLLKMKDVIADSVNEISGGGVGVIPGLNELLKELDGYLPGGNPPEAVSPGSRTKNLNEFNLSPELINMFVSETEELLQDMEAGLITWEADPGNKEIISSLFRGIHTLKGNCGFYGFGDIEKLSHNVENLLDAAKAGVRLDLKSVTKNLLSIKDLIGKALTDIKNEGSGEIPDLHIYIGLIEKILPKGWSDTGTDNMKSDRLGNILVTQGVIDETDIKKVVNEQNKPFGEKLVDMGLATTGQVESALQKQKNEDKKIKERDFSISHSKGQEIAKRQNIRVDLDKLDTLINLIGEMAIAENMITNNPEILSLKIESFTKAAQHMNKIVRELQEMAMTIRMVPVSGLFRRMIRLVHDLSNKCNKKVDFKLVGEETEVDKTVVEIITDPLVHIIRNSLDHGLEGSEERLRMGKTPSGALTLSASHEEGQVRITITDDGRGLNREKILSKAMDSGLVDDNSSTLTDQQVFALIFNPGFSTADRITDVSGRGVGMDVVKKNLDKVKGRVSIKSKAGKGTRISLRIPLTLAIIDGMVIRINDLKYVIPVLSIKESFVPTPDVITETPDGSSVVKVRNKFHPVIRFDDLFKDYSKTETKPLTKGVLVLLENQDSNVCLFVDELIGQQQIVIKALSRYIDDVRGVSGCTILGDGEICLIIDVGSLLDSVEQKETANQ